MAISVIDLLAALAIVALVSGLGGVTFRACLLLLQLIPPKPRWVERGTILAVLFVGYVVLLGLGVPGVLAGMRTGNGQATLESVTRTGTLAAWAWTLNTILLMLARGQLGEQPKWRRP